MRLAIVCEHASARVLAGDGPGGAAARQLAEGAGVLRRAGHDIQLYASADGSDSDRSPDGVPVLPLPAAAAGAGDRRSYTSRARAIGEHLTAYWTRSGWIPDVIHAHHWRSGLAAVAARRVVPAPVVLTFHELGAARARHLGGSATGLARRVGLERWLAARVDRVVTECHAERDELIRHGADRHRISLIPPAIDPYTFAPGARTGRPGAKWRILAVGSPQGLPDRKGLSDVVRALPGLPDTELVVVGGGTGDGARRLHGLARACRVGDRVHLVGPVPPAHMPEWYRSADLVVCASWYEPFGITAVEAMACGVPVLATAVGGLKDTVVNNVTGALVPPHDPAALAGAARSVLADPVRRLGYAVAARDRACQCYSWDRVVPRLEAEYRQLCGAPTATG